MSYYMGEMPVFFVFPNVVWGDAWPLNCSTDKQNKPHTLASFLHGKAFFVLLDYWVCFFYRKSEHLPVGGGVGAPPPPPPTRPAPPPATGQTPIGVYSIARVYNALDPMVRLKKLFIMI